MSPRDFVLLISIVSFSTSSSIIRSQRLLIVNLLPESMRTSENMLNRWKRIVPERKTLQIRIDLMKSYVSPDENWVFSNEYKHSSKDYDASAKVTPTTNEKKVTQVEDNDMNIREKEIGNNDSVPDIVMPDELIPQIDSRNIITVPEFCPKGQKKDSRGRCRTVL